MTKKDGAKSPIIISIASGKGGVGKTVLSINLSFALAGLGKKVILIDLDFGGANIHTCMGYEIAPDGIGNFLNQNDTKLSDYLLETESKNLKLIPGDAEMVGIANISAIQKKRLIKQIQELDAEYILLDLGAGSSYNTVDFFMISSFGIIVAMPEITSILNAYAFLKNTAFRILYAGLRKDKDALKILSKYTKTGGEAAWKIGELMEHFENIDPEIHAQAVQLIDSFNPKLIINMAYKPKDLAMGEKLRKISNTYIGIDLEYIGFLYRDRVVEESVSSRKPLAILSPKSQTYETIVRMAYKIVNAKRLPYFLLDINDYDDSLEILLEEATDDLISRIEGYEELADENLLTVNELLSIVKNLEYENLSLKKDIERLKAEMLKYKKF
jgi:flagellar biosynthesis protein FlhG